MAKTLDSVLRYAAFTREPGGGNRAGVVLDANGWSDAAMQSVATEVGYSETAFVIGGSGDTPEVRYFSPAAEVPFCGHATIALAVALAERFGPADRVLLTRSGEVPVQTVRNHDGVLQATLTSVPPQVLAVDQHDLRETMDLLGWTNSELHPELPPRVGFAGASHPHHRIVVYTVSNSEGISDSDLHHPTIATSHVETVPT